MLKLISYQSSQQFLEATAHTLEKKELQNNVILGIVNGLSNKNEPLAEYEFINVIEDNEIKASSVKTPIKTTVSSNFENDDYIKLLAEYYLDKNISLNAVMGETFHARAFAKFYGRPEASERTLIVHQLEMVNHLTTAHGEFETAEERDIDVMVNWMLDMQEETNLIPRQSRAQILKTTEGKFASNDLFKWAYEGKIVSMAGLVRKTKNVGVVGRVYTPRAERGQGYATSCVQKLSENILQRGFKYCGLFTDKANPTSNHIYKQIGYQALTEFTDIEFG